MIPAALLLYGGVTFLGACLLFLVQPLVGKAILPWFGGTPTVWSTCMVFFQAALLAGYAGAHALTRLEPGKQTWVYLAALAASLAQLPMGIPAGLSPEGRESPVGLILALLTVSVGGPYLLLAATTPLVQRWASHDAAAANPYRLYAVSNFGSLLGLLAYPFLVERILDLDGQMALWSVGYVLFAAVVAVLVLTRVRAGAGVVPSGALPAEPPAAGQQLLWAALAAAGSGLLVSATNEMTLNVAVVPFLWVLPLALYLVTFMIAFGGRYSRRLTATCFVAALLVASYLHLVYASVLWQIAGISFVLAAGALACHGELARLAPAPRYLTRYYLLIAGGGAMGGTVVAVVSPNLFTEFWEYPLFLLLGYAFLVIAVVRTPEGRAPLGTRRIARVLVPLAIVTAFAWPVVGRSGHTVAARRNFFGVLRVYDTPPGVTPALRRFQHGGIVHGAQFLDPARRGEPTAYYRRPSGIAAAIERHPKRVDGQPMHIGVVGLGIGTLAAWGRAGDTIRFYEINPQVVDVARQHFTFLADTPAAVELVTGDARLALEREAQAATLPRFDLLVADAFSGDAIPVHLMTREATALYWRVLSDDGVLVFNITNRYLDVAPVVQALAESAGRQVVRVVAPGNAGESALPTDWMIVTSNGRLLAALTGPDASPGARLYRGPSVLWTDRFSNLFDVLR